MGNNKQTAVEWLLERADDADLTKEIWEQIKIKAKAMEREQHEEIFSDGCIWGDNGYCCDDFEEYYEQTYGK